MGDCRFPSWSPDGRTIDFVSYKGDGGEIYLIPAKGGDATPLTNIGFSGDVKPVWSLDGKTIFYLVQSE